MPEYSEDDRATINRLMSKYRDARGYTDTSLAGAVGCHKSHISRVINGKKPPSLDLVQKLHTVLRFGEPKEGVDNMHEFDREVWFQVTHVEDLREELGNEQSEHEANIQLRFYLNPPSTS
jgi:transcriptional regulator with XRE-family HTH domain